MRREALKSKIPELHFEPEGYTTSGDPEFLDQLLEYLRSSGYDPDNLLFSGIEGKEISGGKDIPRHGGVFAMNQAGWRKALNLKEANPAMYAAKKADVPCIALYDRDQMAHIYNHSIHQEEDGSNAPIEIDDIEIGDALADLPLGDVVEEAVTHRYYPNALPADALVGLVFTNPE